MHAMDAYRSGARREGCKPVWAGIRVGAKRKAVADQKANLNANWMSRGFVLMEVICPKDVPDGAYAQVGKSRSSGDWLR